MAVKWIKSKKSIEAKRTKLLEELERKRDKDETWVLLESEQEDEGNGEMDGEVNLDEMYFIDDVEEKEEGQKVEIWVIEGYFGE